MWKIYFKLVATRKIPHQETGEVNLIKRNQAI